MGGVNRFQTRLPVAAEVRRLRPVRRLGGGRLLRLDGEGTHPLVDFSSNDYLALAEHPALITASRRCLEQLGAGAGAARLMSGDLELFHTLETEVACLKGREAALVFGSGYLANLGVIPALVGRDDVIFCDRLNHASIYDGCRLAGARLMRFRHNDPEHLEDCLKTRRGAGAALIVVESIYSMDGDLAPLRDLVALKNRYDCLLMVDEAHATGLYGENGGGVIQAEGLALEVDVALGTFGKALGSYGAFVAGSRGLVELLVNRARSFIYSTALPPAVAGASLAAVRLVRRQPALRADLHRKVALFKAALHGQGITTDLGPSQIIPLMVGESGRAMELAAALGQRGIFATAVRPPTVPHGTARLRFSITRHHTEDVLRDAAAHIGELARQSLVQK
ncbi:MAG: 8-amino-7-oxononanoate synthase [Deltaproteobacteria bacterium CG_4_10_14_3_um_filter_60_8]|nr:MAG: 8-amino-7-oxononanoate synthase [Desulfobacterales bacterium CG2_30_60_27]PIY21040.1 MAG: 8-amino-7-oxononanoate synthase [Deltaproteobacteria bacterium CG_4_10_14_3_um_filter_60_8]